MALSNCVECGRLFNKTRERVCEKCLKAEEEEFDRVVEYIRTERVYFIPQISDETGVGQQRIMKWVRDGKLELASGTEQSMDGCKRCGQPTSGGAEICSSCRKKLAAEIAMQRQAMAGGPAQPDAVAEPGKGMHHLPR